MKTAIEFKNVSCGYHSTTVLDNINFQINEGEMIAVLGPNGAGKTTLFKALTGLLRPTTGIINIFSNPPHTLSAQKRSALIAVVPQELETPMAFNVEEIVMLGRTASLSRWATPNREDHRIVERCMVYTDIADLRDRPLSELSGGEKQRAIVAMALAQEPKIILLDEATSHLDMNHRFEVMQIAKRLNSEEGVTVLMCSHDLNLAAEFCDRFLLLDHGRVVANGSSSDVLTERILSDVYHCDVRVQQHVGSGSVTISPAHRLTPTRAGQGIRVHLVAGGGSGEELMRRLILAGYEVSCGVLNNGDSDTEIAHALGVKTTLEAPFSPISNEALQRSLEAASSADVIIVCDVPFGPGNVANLKIAEHAGRQKKPVLIAGSIEKRDYTHNKAASAISTKLLAAGARTWHGIPEVMKQLPQSK